ncbi:MAG TPA: 4'-phosphopantetheinyl transferase superfamily protein [Candidatus Polarisedimenticolia bacterium]|nr:4'-phosphopantetheinyl transferase superfamily protein [Candidatus Polarisedimenticolia bacterium]
MNSSADTILWPPCANAPPLAPNEIHVWATTLAPTASDLEKFAMVLSLDETERAHKFRFEKHRNRFIAGRGALRHVLAPYLRTTPKDIRFSYSDNGKPALAGELAGAGIHFNLAHSEELALAAVTRIGIVGVDVERVRPVENVDHLVARFFSARENEAFQKVPSDEKPAAFFNLWTRKEALLKATGEGITRSLSLVEVSFLPGEPARLLAISGDAAKAAEWSLRDFLPATGFVGAVAIRARNIGVQCWKWETEK